MSTCSRRKSAKFIVYACFVFIVSISTAQDVKNAYVQNVNPQQLLQSVPPQLLLKIANLFTSGSQNDVTSRAGELLVTGLKVAVANSKYNVSSTCLAHTEICIEALLGGEQWALRTCHSAELGVPLLRDTSEQINPVDGSRLKKQNEHTINTRTETLFLEHIKKPSGDSPLLPTNKGPTSELLEFPNAQEGSGKQTEKQLENKGNVATQPNSSIVESSEKLGKR